ncbi:MAG: hypothetical protein H7836_10385 [Magnetococcus sp. YQC-3]
MAFFKYVYLPDTVANIKANVLADLVLMMTGTTNVNSLSTLCDKANSLIVSDVPAGWTLHDNAAGTNAKCLKAPMADDPTAFKYVVLDTNSDAYCMQKLYYSWDATAHTGKFLTAGSDSGSLSQYVQNVASTFGGIMFGWVTARYMVLLSRVNNQWGDPSSTGATVVAERSRMWPLDIVSAGVPPVIHTSLGWLVNSSSSRVYAPLKITRTGGFASGQNAFMDFYAGIWGLCGYNAQNTFKGQFKKALNSAGQSFVPIYPIHVADVAECGLPYGNISDVCDMYIVPGGILGTLEVVTYNGNAYHNIPARQSTDDFGLLVRRG